MGSAKRGGRPPRWAARPPRAPLSGLESAMVASSSVAGEWQHEGANGSQRRLRVAERGDRLEIEVQHASPVLVLTSDGSPAGWNALFDPGRAPWAPPGPEAKPAYYVELSSAGHLCLRRSGAEGPSVEFERLSGPPARGSDDDASRSPILRRPRPVRSHSPQQQQQAQHPLPPRPGSPGLFAMEDGEEEEDLRERLIAQVKARQKASKGVNKRWREFCQKEGGGIFDPNRHDAGFLEDFIERESRTVRLQGQSGRSRSRGRGASASGTRGGRWREDSGSLSSPRRPQRARRRSPKTGKRRGHRHGGRRREKHRPRDEEAAGRGRARDRKRRRRQRKTGKAPKEKASASPSGSSDSGESSAPSSELVAAKGAVPQERPELVTARSAAEAARAARISAEAALDEAKEATAAEVETRVRVEEERQQAEVARFVQEVEREARWEEEERVQEAVRQAREAREAKVEASRHRAEEDAREAVLAMRSRAREDVALRLETAEARVKDASAEESRTATALEVLLAESARLRQAGAVPEDGAVAAGGCRTRRKAKLTAPRAAKRRKERANENSGSGSSSSSDSSSEGGPSGGSSIDSGTQKHP
uniref:Uncharacterized protein n=1 Tax=Alexandrium monilatum TaxID=311494 RepID=A0A7S4UIX1_9DINO